VDAQRRRRPAGLRGRKRLRSFERWKRTILLLEAAARILPQRISWNARRRLDVFTNFNPSTAKALGADEKEPTSAETVSLDTVMVDLSGGTQKLAVAAAHHSPRAGSDTLKTQVSTSRSLRSPRFRPSQRRWARGGGRRGLARERFAACSA